ncbi:MAG: YbjN domain-containing protein [Bacteriovoracaceae bacterium]|nr:YbjN domain-containing protein [Bacteriovoracaceae bacterium]
MSTNLEKVKGYLCELGFDITHENAEEALLVIDDESKGIQTLILDCEDPILVIEQFIFENKTEDEQVYKRLLQMNRTLVHGAFVLDETGNKVLFRDTLQLANLDLNELEATINSLSLGLAEYSNEFIGFCK